MGIKFKEIKTLSFIGNVGGAQGPNGCGRKSTKKQTYWLQKKPDRPCQPIAPLNLLMNAEL